MTSFLSVTPLSWPTTLALLAAIATILFLPGYLLCALFVDRKDIAWFEHLPLSVALSIAVGLVLASLASLTKQPLLRVFGAIAGLDLAAAFSLILLRRRRSTEGSGHTLREAHPLLLLAFILLTATLLVRFSLPVDYTQLNDAWTYLSYIRKWAAAGQVSAQNVFVGTAEAVSGFRHIFGGWLVIQALLSVLSKVDPIDIYTLWLPPLLMFSSYLAFYSLARTLFCHHNAAILSTLVQAINLSSYTTWRDSLGRTFFFRTNEDKFLLTFLLLPVATLFMLRYLRSARRGDLICLLLLSAALPLLHPLGLVEAGLTFGLFAFVHVLFDHRRETIIRFLLIFLPLLLLLAIPLVERRLVETPYSMDTPEGQAKAEIRGGRFLILDTASNKYMTSLQFLRLPVLITALALTPFLLFRLKREMEARFLFGNMCGLLFLLYNPVLTPLLGRLITPWMLWRLTYLFPASLVIGFWLWKGMELIPRILKRYHRAESSVGPLLALSIILGGAVLFWRQDILQWPAISRGLQKSAKADLLLHARDFVREPSMILCVEDVQKLVPAFLEHGFVPAHKRAEISETARRDAAAFYASEVIDQTAWDTLQKYHYTYLIGNAKASAFFWVFPLLTPLYANDRYVLYKVAPVSSEHPLILSNTYFRRGEWEAAAAAYEQAKSENPLVASLRLCQIREAQGLMAEAIEHCKEALALAESDAALPSDMAEAALSCLPASWRPNRCLPEGEPIMLPNAGFEQDDGRLLAEGTDAIAGNGIPDGWGLLEWGVVQPAVRVQQDDPWRVEGAYSLRLDILETEPRVAVYSSRFSLAGAARVSADVIVRALDRRIPIGITLAFYDGNGEQIAQYGDLTSLRCCEELVQISLCTLVPEGATSAEVYLTVDGLAPVGQSVWFDDLRVMTSQAK